MWMQMPSNEAKQSALERMKNNIMDNRAKTAKTVSMSQYFGTRVHVLSIECVSRPVRVSHNGNGCFKNSNLNVIEYNILIPHQLCPIVSD